MGFNLQPVFSPKWHFSKCPILSKIGVDNLFSSGVDLIDGGRFIASLESLVLHWVYISSLATFHRILKS